MIILKISHPLYQYISNTFANSDVICTCVFNPALIFFQLPSSAAHVLHQLYELDLTDTDTWPEKISGQLVIMGSLVLMIFVFWSMMSAR
jgi:hypothetical protein